MAEIKSFDSFNFSAPAMYVIRVKGFLDESWSERFGGMQINNKFQGKVLPMTELVGEVSDQAGLFGVVSSLYEMHLPLVSIELLVNSED